MIFPRGASKLGTFGYSSYFFMKLTFPFLAALVCAALPAWAVPVSVTVVGPDDKPVADAKLSLIESGYAALDTTRPREIAGENGRFNFERDGAFPVKDAPLPVRERRLLYVRVAAPGLATETRLLAKPETTIQLQKGRSWGGVVLGDDAKPIAGVAVKLTRWFQKTEVETEEGAAPREVSAFETVGQDGAKRAVTNAEGRWQMDDLPVKARAQIALDDARFVKKSFDVSIGEGDAPPLFARTGATLTGVLVAPDGAPIGDAPITIGWGGEYKTRTDAAGRFTLSGVEPGEVSLRSGAYYGDDDEKKRDYIVPPLEKMSAVAGETKDVGNWKAVKGIKLLAQFVDAETKKPIEGVTLYFWEGGTMTSDERGHVEAQLSPATLDRDGSNIASSSVSGYVSSRIARPQLEKNAESVDLGTIELQRGNSITGTVRIEGEDPKVKRSVPNLRLSKGQDQDYLNLWGGQNKFTSQALKPGTYKIMLGYGGDGKDKDWEIVSPANLVVPAPGTKAEPVEIVLKRLTPFEPLLGSISGRVVDETGAGVGGAIVSARLRADNSYTTVTAVSGGDGAFALERTYGEFAATQVEVLSVERPGYFWAGKPTAVTAGEKTVLSDLALKKRGAIFKGHVVPPMAGQRKTPGLLFWKRAIIRRCRPTLRACSSCAICHSTNSLCWRRRVWISRARPPLPKCPMLNCACKLRQRPTAKRWRRARWKARPTRGTCSNTGIFWARSVC